jgi:hypothetical protein
MEIVENEVLSHEEREYISAALSMYYSAKLCGVNNFIKAIMKDKIMKKSSEKVLTLMRQGINIHNVAVDYASELGLEHSDEISEELFIAYLLNKQIVLN